ncbi:SpoIIE family protein phosphatase [Candidatus Villigracilis affinis]|uniref:PP2C family protein-serine/threonine phosphatase n=1 Tax=Candidatus Villigracilis affinis TaxID=3140682 RepID=UPI002A222185|nr:SpoIIE family protein phosphatase [Anaerolineales bacterium]
MNHQSKILIVDDEPFNVDYLEQELEDLNYITATAVNGQDALEKIVSESPDLVLLDIMMPIMDGFSVLEKVKADPAIRNIPIIVISANNDLQSVVKGIQLGAEDYLPKPFEPTLLKARIQSSLEKKHLRDMQDLYLKSLEREMNIARDIQKEFLPAQLPDVPGWEIASYFEAAKEVAGDFYDAFTLPDGTLTFLVADVCGKGIGAALFMTLFRSLIHAASISDQFSPGQEQKSLSPAERLQHVISLTNNYVAETHEESNMFATVFIGILDPVSGKLSYINGGNEPPLIVGKDGKVHTTLTRTGSAIGAIAQAKFTVKETTLASDDLLVAFTDGIPDTQNIDGEFFGNERLRELLMNHSSPTQLLNEIELDLEQFIGEAEQFDDITLLAIKRKAS